MHSLADAKVHGGGSNDGERRRLAPRACRIQRILAEGVQHIPPRMLACLRALNKGSGRHTYS